MLTIFTPAYNRAYILPELYASLQNQTNKSFQWLIVDDGSSDKTQELVENWQKEKNDFTIIYIKQKNGGKHRAINTGVNNAKGDFFFIVDSDDSLPNNAVEIIARYTSEIAGDSRFAGICGLRANAKGIPLANSGIIKNVIDVSMIDIRQEYKVQGDMAEVFKTDILRQYPFPEFKGEKFVNEAAVWNKIAEKYILRFIPDILYICEYLNDGLTKSIRKQHRNNPMGTMYLYNGIISSPFFSLKKKIRSAILYWRYLLTFKKAYSGCTLFSLPFWPIGAIFYYLDSRNIKK